MANRARDARSSLLVVDLESRGGVRRVLEWRARRLAVRLAAGGRRGDPLPQVLLHLPEGVGPSVAWPAGARVSRTSEHIAPSRLREIHERAFATSFNVARGALGDVFPDVCGVGLGELNLMTIQKQLASFSMMASALGDLVGSGQIGACHILSGDVGFARALERQITGLVEAVSTWPPRRLLEAERWARAEWSALQGVRVLKAERAARDSMTARLRQYRLGRTRPRVLLVSESIPIAHTFAVVEEALGRAGVGPTVRLDFSGGSPRVAGAGAVVCSCGPHGALGLRAGPFGARWPDGLRALRSHQALRSEDAQDALALEGLIGYLYASRFDAQARHLWAADTALQVLQPEVILMGNDRWWGGQTFVQLARRRGIPSVCVQDGLAGEHPSWWWLAADRMAATSEQVVQALVRHGVSPERCRVTGQPRYDLLARSGPDDERIARTSLGLDPSTFAVLFAAQWMHGPDYVWGVVSALLAVPGIRVMLRPHPSDRRDLWDRLMREYGSERVTLHRAGDSLSLVRACDALVTQHSTVVLEAALLGKAVITTEFGGLSGPAGMIADGIATQVRGLEQLTREVRRLATAAHAPRPKPSGSLPAAWRGLIGPVDGRAGDRVAELVAELLQRVPSGPPRSGDAAEWTAGARQQSRIGTNAQVAR